MKIKMSMNCHSPLGLLVCVAVIAGTALPAIAAEKHRESVQRLKHGTSETLEAAASIASETKAQAQKRLEKEMKRMDSNLDDLRTRAEKAGADAKARIMEELPKLDQRKRELEDKLDDLKTRSGKAWDEMATGTESALHELRKSFEKAKSHFD